MTLLVVAPLQAEADNFTEGLRERGHGAEPFQIGRLAALRFPTLDTIAACGGHGKTQYGVQTQHLIDSAQGMGIELEGVFCVGAAGALASDLAVGDLVIATETVEHDYTQRFGGSRPLPRFPGDEALLGALRALPLHALPCGVHQGIVASGDEDVIELERAAALRMATEACAVAWEGAGGARACRFSAIPFVELRGISDTADHNAPAHFRANLRLAMANAAALIALWRGAASR